LEEESVRRSNGVCELVSTVVAYAKKAAAELRRDLLILLLLGVLLVVRIIYILSYPFFIEGDGYTYYHLILEYQAHLLHATGYVFFALAPRFLAVRIGVDPAKLLLYMQQAFTIASLLTLYLALKRVLPRWISFLTCLFLGLDIQLIVATGTTRPEFFQADLMMLLMSSAVFALTSSTGRVKTTFYFAAGILLTAGYITKYNFLPAIIFCLVPMFDSELNWRGSLRMVAVSGIGATLLLLIFVAGFHYPTTGSLSLNLEHGWVYFMKLQEAAIPLLPANGIATQKYIVLSDQLPPMGAGPGPWRKIDEVPDEIRAPFRREWAPLIRSNDAGYVRAVFDRLEVSAHPEKSYQSAVALYPIYYHLGLKEGEKLLGDVFWEAVRAYPRQYLTHVWTSLRSGANYSTQYMPYLPVPGVYEPVSFFKFSKFPLRPFRTRVFEAVDWSLMRPEDLAAQIWYPGAKFFSRLAFFKQIPSASIWIMNFVGLAVLPFLVSRRRHFRNAGLLLVLATIVLLGELSLSAVVFVFRMKELILCQPLIYVTAGISMAICVEFIMSFLPSARRFPVV